MSDKKLKDKVAVVTGGGRGIGKAICLAFAREGASVMVASNVKAENENVAEMLRKKGTEAFAYTVDTTDVEQVAGLAAEVKKRFGKLDILANNAGVVGKRAFTWEFDDKIQAIISLVVVFPLEPVTAITGKLNFCLRKRAISPKARVVSLTLITAIC